VPVPTVQFALFAAAETTHLTCCAAALYGIVSCVLCCCETLVPRGAGGGPVVAIHGIFSPLGRVLFSYATCLCAHTMHRAMPPPPHPRTPQSRTFRARRREQLGCRTHTEYGRACGRHNGGPHRPRKRQVSRRLPREAAAVERHARAPGPSACGRRCHASAACARIVIGGGSGGHARAQHAPRLACRGHHRACARRHGGRRYVAACAQTRQRRPPRDTCVWALAAAAAATRQVHACRRQHSVYSRRHGGRRYVVTCRQPRQRRPPRERCARAAATASPPAPAVTVAAATLQLVGDRSSGGRRGTGVHVPPPQLHPRPPSRRPSLQNILWAHSAAAAAAGQMRACCRAHRACASRHGGRR